LKSQTGAIRCWFTGAIGRTAGGTLVRCCPATATEADAAGTMISLLSIAIRSSARGCASSVVVVVVVVVIVVVVVVVVASVVLCVVYAKGVVVGLMVVVGADVVVIGLVVIGLVVIGLVVIGLVVVGGWGCEVIFIV